MKQSGSAHALLTTFFSLILSSCSDSTGTAVDAPLEAPRSSFGQLQTHVFARQCVACHSPRGTGLIESGLNLESAAIAYTNLIGAVPRNAVARQEGMYRVFPRDPERSLLFHKLQWNPDHHGGRSFGNPMPLGGEPLSIGQLE